MATSHHSRTTAALTYLGAAYASIVTYKVARFFWRHYLRPRTNLVKRYRGNGDSPSWAVVTGATSGIGRGCALALAEQGFNVVLVARTTKDLEDLAGELQARYGISTMYFSMDAAQCSEPLVNDLIKQLDDKSIAILVNSVGILNERPLFVDEMEFSLAQRIIQVNCSFTVLLTSKVIPLIRLHASQNSCRGAILNVGSLTSSSPFAMNATYAATKSFNAQWSRCLAAELHPEPIDVLCVRPGLTASRMSGLLKPGGIVADADDFAKRALGVLGLGVNDILPYPPHAFLDWLATVVPETVQGSATRAMNLQKRQEMGPETKKCD
jgi:17beta-estradiol 17-dehydrogenase / very-long-chain 3-oxoacyl-CoA reductase